MNIPVCARSKTEMTDTSVAKRQSASPAKSSADSEVTQRTRSGRQIKKPNYLENYSITYTVFNDVKFAIMNFWDIWFVIFQLAHVLPVPYWCLVQEGLGKYDYWKISIPRFWNFKDWTLKIKLFFFIFVWIWSVYYIKKILGNYLTRYLCLYL